MAEKKQRISDSSQIDGFKVAARELSGEIPEAEFDRVLGQIGRSDVPKDEVKPADRQKKSKRNPLKLGI